MSHTPGPWMWDGTRLISEDGEAVVYECYQDIFETEHLTLTSADAHLIAAAPDLLAVCEDLPRVLVHGSTQERLAAAKAVMAAIARAKGEG
jgi:hypothetical protein